MKRATLLRMMAASPVALGAAALVEKPALAEKPAPEEPAPVPHLTAAELKPELDGKEVTMAFEVAEVYWISGSVPVGQVASFGIRPVHTEPAYGFSVLVSGDLADAMERFGMGPLVPNSSKGRVIQATGRLKLFPAAPGDPGRKASYQFNIREWKKFKLLPPR